MSIASVKFYLYKNTSGTPYCLYTNTNCFTCACGYVGYLVVKKGGNTYYLPYGNNVGQGAWNSYYRCFTKNGTKYCLYSGLRCCYYDMLSVYQSPGSIQSSCSGGGGGGGCTSVTARGCGPSKTICLFKNTFSNNTIPSSYKNCIYCVYSSGPTNGSSKSGGGTITTSVSCYYYSKDITLSCFGIRGSGKCHTFCVCYSFTISTPNIPYNYSAYTTLYYSIYKVCQCWKCCLIQQ